MRIAKPFPSALQWRNHFQRSLAEELDAPERDGWADARMAASLKQFQLGESAEGRHLLHYAREHGERTGDPWLGEAMALFIAEENRHARWMGEFLEAQGETLLDRHWLDGAFRVIRKPMGLGLMVAVLLCGEIVAVPYYDSLRKSTQSQWLRAICTRLLRDEAQHLKFQASNLARVWRRWPLTTAFRVGHGALLVISCVACWSDHGVVLRGGGHTLGSFIARCLKILETVHGDAVALVSRGNTRLGTPARSER